MAINAIMKDKYLRELKCAYTGKTVQVRMTGIEGGKPLYFVEGAFDPGDWIKTSKELMKAIGTRDGIEGAVRDGAEFNCPYTGARMSIERHPDLGYRTLHGFRPSIPVGDPFLVARNMMTRDGVAPKNAPKPAVVSAAKIVDTTPDIDIKPVATKDQAMQEAEDLLKDSPLLKAKTSVTVSGGKKK